MLLLSQGLIAQYQLDNKLTCTGAVGVANLGGAVSLSADGKKLVTGGYNDDNGKGAAWVFGKINGTWQQEAKLLASDATAEASQGISVAISGDGNTIIVGGLRDNSFDGAAFIFSWNGSEWVQQGPKLVGIGANQFGSGAYQGASVALSYDGNTAVVGGGNDDEGMGSLWVYERNGSTWTQTGNKLQLANGINMPQFGWSVAISGDGNTIVGGAAGDNTQIGALAVFVRDGNSWLQQGSKLTPSDGTELSELGSSVALSYDGNTLAAGGTRDNHYSGAVWIFTRNAGNWSQQGPKLVGTNAVNTPYYALQGTSVGLSASGDTLVLSGEDDNNLQGALWVFTRSGNTWSQLGDKFNGSGAIGSNAKQGSSVAISANAEVIAEGGIFDDSDKGAVWVFDRRLSYLDEEEAVWLQIHPNPSEGRVTLIASPGISGSMQVEISTISGQVIHTADLSGGQRTIDLTSYAPGVYMVKIVTGDKQVTERIILE
jgi:Secretion system C-terminal sorting domain/FG-GAP repeat